jgi:octanoyl-[GcvH]:protein N-octanoyltransferase
MHENAHKPPLRLIRQSFLDPAFGTAVSDAILARVARGELPATFRLHRPPRELAFAKQDRVATEFGDAVGAARRAGFEPVIRMAGGRAAVFHEGTLAIAWAQPDSRPVARIRHRFEQAAGIVAAALRRVGVDAEIGEIPGEWCPGTWSVNARGEVKLAGIGQRMIAGASHIGAVVIADRGELVRAALEPVYSALALDWDPATAGSVAAEVEGVGLADVEMALIDELGERFELRDADLDPETLALAAELEDAHRIDPPTAD